MSRPTRARVRLDALRSNYRLAKRLSPGAKVLAVVKANAYGHGAVAVARALAPEADGFAVACLEEALELRESGVQGMILLLDGIFSPTEIPQLDQTRLTTVIHSWLQVEWVLAARPARPIDCWLKIDSGMHRIGLAPEELARAYAVLRACPHVGAVVLMSHFARADEPDHPATERQLACFAGAAGALPVPVSLANSAALLTRPDVHADWVRPGIMLYGVSPFGVAASIALRPVMTFESALIARRDLAPGEAIGYGGRFVCERPTRVGVVAAGYADGYPRHAPDGTPVAVKGRLTRIIGRVSMDLLTLDLTDLADADIGDPVELWGETVPVEAVAQASDTIPYQLFTNLNRRVPLVFEMGDDPGLTQVT
ncbi:MAG: alanine racemase [Sphingobacteriia bacterium]|nr:alanine racemase [Sphingobacteriia bacterium]NCC39290.1 alanine racemase [Gammaproteobacteria bacterium]